MAKQSKLDDKTSEVIAEIINRLYCSASPLVLVGEQADPHLALSVIKGLKRVKRSLVNVSEEELHKLSTKKYKELVQSHDFIITIDYDWDKRKISYFPFDARNDGAYVLSSSVKPNKRLEDVDVYMIMELPGLFAHIIRGLLMKERS